MEVIESEDEDEAADEDADEDADEAADEDADAEEARAPSPQGEWLAPDGHVSPCGWRGPWASSDEDSFTSSSDISEMSEEEVKDTPNPAAAAAARRVVSDDEDE